MSTPSDPLDPLAQNVFARLRILSSRVLDMLLLNSSRPAKIRPLPAAFAYAVDGVRLVIPEGYIGPSVFVRDGLTAHVFDRKRHNTLDCRITINVQPLLRGTEALLIADDGAGLRMSTEHIAQGMARDRQAFQAGGATTASIAGQRACVMLWMSGVASENTEHGVLVCFAHRERLITFHVQIFGPQHAELMEVALAAFKTAELASEADGHSSSA